MKTLLLILLTAVVWGYAGYSYLHQKTGHSLADAIRDHRPILGMTEAQLKSAMGEPTTVNPVQKSTGVEEDWYYSGTKVTMRDGKVSEIENASVDPNLVPSVRPSTGAPNTSGHLPGGPR